MWAARMRRHAWQVAVDRQQTQRHHELGANITCLHRCQWVRSRRMARADLLVRLVKAGTSGDRTGARSVAAALIADKRAKSHHILADPLTRSMANGKHASVRGPAGAGSERWREYAFESTRRLLEDPTLSEGTFRACRQLIEDRLLALILHAHSMEPRHRILLVGPPGNGKTSLAEALSVPFLIVRYETMIGSYSGEPASPLRSEMDFVQPVRSLLFFNEFDTVAKERGDNRETSEIKWLVSSHLLQVGVLTSFSVAVVSTNHPGLLDHAVWRTVQLRLRLERPTMAHLVRYLRDRRGDGGRLRAGSAGCRRQLGIHQLRGGGGVLPGCAASCGPVDGAGQRQGSGQRRAANLDGAVPRGRGGGE